MRIITLELRNDLVRHTNPTAMMTEYCHITLLRLIFSKVYTPLVLQLRQPVETNLTDQLKIKIKFG